MKSIKKISALFLLPFLLINGGCSSPSTSSSAHTHSTAEHTQQHEGNTQRTFTMLISINPEVELTIDADTGNVIKVTPVNEDAKALLKEGNIELINLPYDAAAEVFISECHEQGYLTNDNNDIQITVDQAQVSDTILHEYNDRMKFIYELVSSKTDFELAMQMDCLACAGTGRCDLCNGRSTLPCDACNDSKQEGNNEEIQCDMCNGEGRLECTECNGQGEYTCPDCNGEGKVTCFECGGYGGCQDCAKTGIAPCDMCGGTGINCGWCFGSGTMECKTCHGHTICEACADYPGSGYRHCETCGGNGKVRCNRCNGDRYEVCPQCGGQHNDASSDSTCYRCGGTGQMTCVRCTGDGLCPSCHGTKTIIG